jgi:hypothetical protein
MSFRQRAQVRGQVTAADGAIELQALRAGVGPGREAIYIGISVAKSQGDDSILP